MSDYSGSFPPPPEDPPSYPGSFPPPPEDPPSAPAYAGAFPPPVDSLAEVVLAAAPPAPDAQGQGRLGTFELGLALHRGSDHGVDDEPDRGAEHDDAEPTRTADAVIFTWTGMISASPYSALNALAASVGVPGAVLMDLVRGPSGSDESGHIAHRHERGELGTASYAEELESRLAEEFGVTVDYESQIRPLLVNLDINEIVVDFVEELRAEGYRTALVMNASRDVAQGRRQTVAVHALFDVVVESWNQGIRKPNRVMYATALKQLEVEDPSRVVVLDPNLSAVESARAVGMVGIQIVRDPVQALRQLNVHLGRTGAGSLALDGDT